MFTDAYLCFKLQFALCTETNNKYIVSNVRIVTSLGLICLLINNSVLRNNFPKSTFCVRYVSKSG